jgi:urease accessory protein
MTSSSAHLQLSFDEAGGAPRMTSCLQEPPWKVVRSFALADGSCLVHLHNLSGGVLAGDQFDLDIRVGPRAHVQLTTAGATRVYRANPGDPPARQRVHAEAFEDALIEYLPDPIIPFAGSRYSQHSVFHLARHAGLFWWEIAAPGRAAERFVYRQLDIATEIYAEGRPVAIERARLEPTVRPLANPAQLGHFTHAATFFICRAAEPVSTWPPLEDALGCAARGLATGEVAWGVSTLVEDGLVVRGLASETRYLQRGLLEFWRLAKLALYGVEPAPPRKVY